MRADRPLVTMGHQSEVVCADSIDAVTLTFRRPWDDLEVKWPNFDCTTSFRCPEPFPSSLNDISASEILLPVWYQTGSSEMRADRPLVTMGHQWEVVCADSIDAVTLTFRRPWDDLEVKWPNFDCTTSFRCQEPFPSSMNDISASEILLPVWYQTGSSKLSAKCVQIVHWLLWDTNRKSYALIRLTQWPWPWDDLQMTLS